ncbi:MAG: GGDEF domain-containing protein [Acidobacteriia bacterium]|nr:GGDEF domain-containing protein [Terriglobia bacterium]
MLVESTNLVFSPEGSPELPSYDLVSIGLAIHKQRGALFRMLVSAIRDLSAASEASLQALEVLELEMANALELEDLERVKPKLAECLERIRQESAHRAPVWTEVPNAAEAQPPGDSFETPNAALPPRILDSVTGLPERRAAEAAIEQAFRSQTPLNVAIMVIDSLRAINMRFGRTTGDALLEVFRDHVAKALSPEDELFRWTGPALVALVRNPTAAFSKVMEQKFEHTVQTPSRAIHLSPAKRWRMVASTMVPEALIEKIDTFINNPSARG